LRAVGAISSQLSSTSWELIQTSGSFLSLRNQAEKLKDEEFGPINEDLIAESLSRCSELVELAKYL